MPVHASTWEYITVYSHAYPNYIKSQENNVDKLVLAIKKLKDIGQSIRAERIDNFKAVYATKSKYGKAMPDRNIDREAWLYAKPEVLDVVSMMEQHTREVYAD